jgi:hypothetical protein
LLPSVKISLKDPYEVKVLIITTDYLFLINPVNFIDTRKTLVSGYNLLLKVRLDSLVNYSILNSAASDESGKDSYFLRLICSTFTSEFDEQGNEIMYTKYQTIKDVLSHPI